LDKDSVVNGIDIDISINLAKEHFGKEKAVKFVLVNSASGIDVLTRKEIEWLAI
jgi:hypothetical protein